MLILIRYGELALKSKPVRRRFEEQLAKNIKTLLQSEGIKFSLRKDYGRFFLKTENQKALEALKRVFGIVSFSPCVKTKSNISALRKEAVQIARKWKRGTRFKIKARRIGQHIFSSQDINREIGAAVANLGFRVNLSKPDRIIFIEARDNNAYVYTEKISGPGGIPIGTEGKVVSVITSKKGLASSWLMMKRGCFIVPVFTNRTKQLLEILKRWDPGIHTSFTSSKPMIEAFKISEELRADAIVTGQTLEDSKDFKKEKTLILRPLVGFTEKEIKNLINKI